MEVVIMIHDVHHCSECGRELRNYCCFHLPADLLPDPGLEEHIAKLIKEAEDFEYTLLEEGLNDD